MRDLLLCWFKGFLEGLEQSEVVISLVVRGLCLFLIMLLSVREVTLGKKCYYIISQTRFDAAFEVQYKDICMVLF